MAKIVGTQASDTLTGRTGADEINGRGGNDTITGNDVSNRELLIDGSFETAPIAANTWGTVKSVGGWHTDTSIEVWGKNFLGVHATDGNKIVEMDSDNRFSKFWQDVQTEQGKNYDFSFDYAQRAHTSVATNTIEVYWNNALVGTYDPNTTAWSKAHLTLTGTGGQDRLEFREQAGQNDSLGGLMDNVSLKAVATGNDVIYGGAGNDHINGLGGDDIIYGGAKPTSSVPTKSAAATAADNDELHGGNGNDTIYGNNGDDKVYGEAGNDTLYGGRGNDIVSGGTGNDRLFGNSGNDTLSDGDGNDVVHGGSGNDRVIAGQGNDVYVGGSGVDTLTFRDATNGVTVDLSKHVADGMGHDRVYGFEIIEGSNYNDVLKGSKHAETLSGGAGNDVLRGFGGADTLIGGAGSDTFVWKLADIQKQASHGDVATIVDMTSSDHIDLRDFTKGMSAAQVQNAIQVQSDGTNSQLFVHVGSGYTEIATLNHFTGHSAHDMLMSGMILA